MSVANAYYRHVLTLPDRQPPLVTYYRRVLAMHVYEFISQTHVGLASVRGASGYYSFLHSGSSSAHLESGGKDSKEGHMAGEG